MMIRIYYQLNIIIIIIIILLLYYYFQLLHVTTFLIEANNSIFSSHLTKRRCHLNLNSIAIHVISFSIVRG